MLVDAQASALEDAPAVQQFLNSQLILFVQVEFERQLLYGGTASTAELTGLLVSRGVPIYPGVSGEPKTTQLFRAMNSMRGSAYIEPDWVICSVSDYEEMRRYRDSTSGTLGAYLAGGPWFGPYGQGGQVSASPQVTGATDTMWGKRVYVTGALGKGTAVVGNTAGASVYSRGGVSVEASNSHGSFLQLDLVALRAERRAALCVFRPKAFVEVRFA